MNKIIKNRLSSKRIKVTITVLIILFTTTLAMAQGPGDPGDENPDVPLKGAVILLLVMGACFFMFKVWQHNQKVKKGQTGIN